MGSSTRRRSRGVRAREKQVDVQRARWIAENEAAIEYYNAFIEEHGLFCDAFRQF